ncbi:MAG TPA: chorismate-binding protein, partial [Puia sp.]|nr:chorismate-binding protein [Puia sp.]
MNRTHVSFQITDFQRTKQQMLNWAGQFNICCFLDNHAYRLPHQSHDCLLAAGALEYLEAHAGNAFTALRHFSNERKDWLFGHFSFDLKNETEQLSSAHPDHIGFPDLFFFVPEVVIELKKNIINIGSRGNDHDRILEQILQYPARVSSAQKIQPVRERFSRQEYINTVEQLRRHILYGDCYEINFCQEFYAENTTIDPLRIYDQLSNASPMPFGAFYKLRDKYLLCASPERYLKKEGRVLISQPIKGTEQRIP